MSYLVAYKFVGVPCYEDILFKHNTGEILNVIEVTDNLEDAMKTCQQFNDCYMFQLTEITVRKYDDSD